MALKATTKRAALMAVEKVNLAKNILHRAISTPLNTVNIKKHRNQLNFPRAVHYERIT